MPVQHVITRSVVVAHGVFAPGHLGELTQILDFALVDAVVAETGTAQRRTRLLPTRVVIYFVLALALFGDCGYRGVWAKLVGGLRVLDLVTPGASSLARARRRVGAAPLRALFEAVGGPVADPSSREVFWRGMRTVALDATTLHVPDTEQLAAAGYTRRSGPWRTFDYPLLRLGVLIECGTRAVIAAVFGPESVGETAQARTLVGHLRAGMLVLADAGYDSWTLLRDITATGAHYVCRSDAGRTPLILEELPDGSYRSVLGYGKLPVRVVEAWVVQSWADGTVTRRQWRLITDLLDHRRYPADDLVAVYHRRWQAETTFLSLKSSMLHGRVLRSQWPAGIDQEVWALLTVYQATVRAAVDAVQHPDAHPGRGAVTPARISVIRDRGSLTLDRISFTVAYQAAADQVTAAAGIIVPVGAPLIGAIGHAVRANPLPPPRHRGKARSKKHATSKYSTNTGQFPRKSLNYAITTHITIMKEGLTPRSKR